MRRLSDAAARLVGQKMFQILARAKDLERNGRDIIHFEIGDPDFDTPAHIATAATQAIAEGDTHYTSSMGLPELRQAAVDVTLRSRKFKPELAQVLVTPGANVQLYLALACAVNPGEEVIIPDPGFVSYAAIIQFLGAVPVRIPLREDHAFRLDPEDVRRAVTPQTRMIIINSPSNPTGAVMTDSELYEVFKIAQQHGVYLLSDEIYARMVYEDGATKFHSPSEYDCCRETTIIVNGFSKSYAMTGWRLGVVTGPVDLISKMGLLLETTLSCVSPFIQRAGVAALKGSQDEIVSMMKEFRYRRDVLVEGLNSISGIQCASPSGAFYAFPNIQGTGYTSEALAELLLEQGGVAVAPGTIFGKHGEGYIRLCYASSVENIKRGLDRIKAVLAKHERKGSAAGRAEKELGL